jgi:putative DNA primase/helicase
MTTTRTKRDNPPPRDEQGVPLLSGELTELEMAERFVARFGDGLRFCRGLKGWHIWTGTHWKHDEAKLAQEHAKDVARRLKEEAADLQDRGTQKSASRAGSLNGNKAILGLAESEPRIVFTVEDADRDGYLLNCANGTVDLRTGKLRAHDRADLITKVVPIAFDPDAIAPRFEEALAEWQPNPDVRAFLQRWAGYAATGVIRDHVFPIAYGEGANGKSTLFDLLARILGDYSAAMPGHFFAIQKNDKHDTEIARLRGVRLAVASETSNGCVLDEAKVKRLTGGDVLTGRFMGKDFIDFRPTAKFVLLTNHRPRLRDTGEGIRRRVLLVPFENVIPAAKRDGELAERLFREEAPGILRWIVDGARDWYARGRRIDPPAVVTTATTEYHEDEDVLARFVDERCTRDANARTAPTVLFNAFRAWCERNGERHDVSARNIGERLDRLGFKRGRSRGVRWIAGIALEHDGPGVDGADGDASTTYPLHTRARAHTHEGEEGGCVTIGTARDAADREAFDNLGGVYE